MGGLPRPDLPPGPQRELVDALHDLHLRAGWPSLRTLAREAGCSHTTVSHVFSSARLPAWGVLELVVEALGGDTSGFHDLWLAAGRDEDEPETRARPAMAGRREELLVVRRHLEAGDGLMLLVGEAGIGKTRLATVAADSADGVEVLTGHCLHLSVDVPLLPTATVLRAAHRTGDGTWLTEALAASPGYVEESLKRLLPEMEQDGSSPAPEDGWSRQRLMSAIRTVLEALSRVRRMAVVLEDLHWADTATLAVLEHLANAGAGPPLLGTFRLDEHTTRAEATEWFTRIRRVAGVTTLELEPLTLPETALQVELLGVSMPPGEIDRLHARSRGQPLFTEQLLAFYETGDHLPALLRDLLDQRLDGLRPGSWPVVVALAVAGHPLSLDVLRAASGLEQDRLLDCLHELRDQHLLAEAAEGRIELQHPLLAEAIQRRLVPGESAPYHQRLAEALEAAPASVPASAVAAHWQAAGRPDREVVCRVRAAREAELRFAAPQAATHWLRAIRIWPPEAHHVGEPPVDLVGAYFAAMDAFEQSSEPERASALAQEALSLAAGMNDEQLAGLYRRAADYLGEVDEESALVLINKATAYLHHVPTSMSHLDTLRLRARTLSGLGRLAEGLRDARRVVEISRELGDPDELRSSLMHVAWYEAVTGDSADAVQHAVEAAALPTLRDDPVREVQFGMRHTDLLLITGGSAEAIEAAGAAGLEAADRWGIDTRESSSLRANVADALRRSGHTLRAAAIIDPLTEADLDPHRWALHTERATLDMMRGRRDDALRRFEALDAVELPSLWNRADVTQYAARSELWLGRPQAAWDRLVAMLEMAARFDAISSLGMLLVLGARAAADLVETTPPGSAARRRHADRLRAIRSTPDRDPLAAPTPGAVAASWAAETDRLAGGHDVRPWLAAAAEWDGLDRPHDAAYARWRAAQANIVAGHAGRAPALLRRAARDAREHAPLLAAILATQPEGTADPSG
ncbi:ATP-binding protein [Nocardioides terrigena]|uniref:ATP-binding protein n=1 Tax=Nocardioides terrigena TaxID=424797 RepID=UPI00131ED66B|nr:AAA family ATPase [Nocardioides terrigena]